MSKPIPGQKYTIQDETMLSQVAARAYGDPALWPRIYDANQSNLKTDETGRIFKGQIIIIPILADLNDENSFTAMHISGKDPDELTIMLEDVEIPITSARIIRTMNTIADGFTAVIPWEYGKDIRLDELTRPFGYTPARAFIGGKLLVSGLLYTTSPGLDKNGSIKELEGWSFTADLIDSPMKPPYENDGKDIFQIAVKIAKATGISIVFEDGIDIGGAFDRATASETESIFNFLLKLAKQRSLLLSSTPIGSLLFTKTTNDKTPVSVIGEGDIGIGEFLARFDGRKRFNSYRAIGQSPGGNKEGIANDDMVPRSRFVTFKVNETIAGDIQKAAEWRRSTQLAEALTIPFTVNDWYDQNGNLWKENTFVTVKSHTLHLPNGFDFLIRGVEYIQSENSRSAILSLVPPQVYTGEKLIDPWE